MSRYNPEMAHGFGPRHEASFLDEMYGWPREVLGALPEVERVIQERIKPRILNFEHQASGVILSGESGVGKGVLSSQIASAVESDPEIRAGLQARGQELAVVYVTTTTGLKFAVDEGVVSSDWSGVTIAEFSEQFRDSTQLLTEAVAKAVVDLPIDYDGSHPNRPNYRLFFVCEQPAFYTTVDVGDSFMNVFGSNQNFEKIGILTNDTVQKRAARIRDSYEQGATAIRRTLRAERVNFRNIPLEVAPTTMGNRNTIEFARGLVNMGIKELFEDPKYSKDVMRQLSRFMAASSIDDLLKDSDSRLVLQRLYYEHCYRNRWGVEDFTIVSMPDLSEGGMEINHYMGYLDRMQLDLYQFLAEDRVAMRRRYPVSRRTEETEETTLLWYNQSLLLNG